MADLNKRLDALQAKLDVDHELTITTELVSDEQLSRGVRRVAYYGGDNDFGETYFVGEINELTSYVDNLVAGNG